MLKLKCQHRYDNALAFYHVHLIFITQLASDKKSRTKYRCLPTDGQTHNILSIEEQ